MIPGLKRLICISCPIRDLAPVAATQGLTWLSSTGAMVRHAIPPCRAIEGSRLRLRCV